MSLDEFFRVPSCEPIDCDQPSCGDASTVQKGRMLKSARLFDADIHLEGGVYRSNVNLNEPLVYALKHVGK
jgi:hypothetical protein